MAGTALPPTITDGTVTLQEAGFITGISAGQYFGYCTIARVKYEFTQTGTTTQLTNSNVAQEIFGAAIELQSELDHYYAMPYSGSNAVILSQLSDLNAKQALIRIIKRWLHTLNNRDEQLFELEGWVTSMYHSIASGGIRWDDPFGDAVRRAMLPVYNLATGAQVSPSPSSDDPNVATPIFTISQPAARLTTLF